MNKELAAKYLNIEDVENITETTLKKQYRKIALGTHPDNYTLENKKLQATKRFIKIKKAYDFLSEELSAKYEQNDSDTSENADIKIRNNLDSTKSKDNIFSYIFWLLFPGGLILSLLLASYVMIVFEFKRMEIKKYKVHKRFLLILVFSLQVGGVIIFFGHIIYKHLINGAIHETNIFKTIIIAQLLISTLIWMYFYFKRKYIERKHKIHQALETIKEYT